MVKQVKQVKHQCSFRHELFYDYFSKWSQQFEKRQIHHSQYLKVVFLYSLYLVLFANKYNCAFHLPLIYITILSQQEVTPKVSIFSFILPQQCCRQISVDILKKTKQTINPNMTLLLPLVIVIVLHHGVQGWVLTA